jgi:hypothetical protein
MGKDPDFLYSLIADPDYGTGTYSVLINILIIFSLLIFFICFLPGFCRKSYDFLQKTRINIYLFMFRQGTS